MNLDFPLLFKIVNLAVLPAWALLIFAPKSKAAQYVVYSYAYPYFLGLFYAFLLFTNFNILQSGMGSLESIRSAFESDGVLLAGWIHYLIFDLFVGMWQVEDARKNNIRHFKIIAPLVFTLFLGPLGLLWYLILRQVERSKKM